MTNRYPLMTVEANNLTFPQHYYSFNLDAGYRLEQRVRRSKVIKRIDVVLVRKYNC